MEIEEATNQDVQDAPQLNEADDPNTAGVDEADAPQLDDEGNPIDPDDAGADEDEEVELDENLKLKVAKDVAAKLKELKDGNLRQADYTRKTQEIAEERKAITAEREAVNQATGEEIAARARIVAADEQLAAYAKVDWDAWENQDPFEAQKGWRQFQQLQMNRGEAAQRLSQLTQERTLAAQQETAKRIEEGRKVLEKDIPGWNPELGAKLLDFGCKTFGFDRAEIEEFTDPRMVKVLHAAFEGLQSRTKQQAAQSHVKAQEVKPAAKVGTATAPKSGLDDRLSIEEWNKRRNEQVRKGR